jgi:hypothetical protein
MAGETASGGTPWGAIAQLGGSAVGGAISGYFDEANKRKQYKKQIEEQKKLQALIAQKEAQRVGEAESAYSPYLTGMDQAVQDYYSSLSNADLSQYGLAQPEEFTFDMEQATQAEMNPDMQAIIDAELGGVKQGAVAGGSLYSGATGKDIARSTADITAKEWDAARTRAQAQQAQNYQRYMDKWNIGKDIASTNRQNAVDQIGLQGQRVASQQGAFGNMRGEVTGIQGTADAALFGSKSEEGAARAAKAGTSRGWRSALSGAIKGLGGL